jgi:Phosphoenolpyruvate phosphomutase
MKTQVEKGKAFRALHQRQSAFIIPNPWDIGTARMLAHMGFEALATTSMGYAFSVGQRDTTIERGRMLEHVSAIAAATELPVNADLENGYGDAPEIAAETIKLAAAAGAAGGSIEDATARPDNPIYEMQHAVERIRAAAEAARALPFTFTLTGRAGAPIHFHAHRPRGKLSARPSGPERYDCAPSGVSGGRRGCALRAGSDQQGGNCRRSQLGGSPGERADGTARRAIEPGGALGDGSEAHQRGERALSHRAGRVPPRGTRNARERHV